MLLDRAGNYIKGSIGEVKWFLILPFFVSMKYMVSIQQKIVDEIVDEYKKLKSQMVNENLAETIINTMYIYEPNEYKHKTTLEKLSG